MCAHEIAFTAVSVSYATTAVKGNTLCLSRMTSLCFFSGAIMLCLSCRCRQPECYNSGPFFFSCLFFVRFQSQRLSIAELQIASRVSQVSPTSPSHNRWSCCPTDIIFSILFSFFSGSIVERAAAAVHANGSIASGVALESRAK